MAFGHGGAIVEPSIDFFLHFMEICERRLLQEEGLWSTAKRSPAAKSLPRTAEPLSGVAIYYKASIQPGIGGAGTSALLFEALRAFCDQRWQRRTGDA